MSVSTMNTLALSCLARGLLVLSGYTTHAAEGILARNSMACTNQVRSDHGVTVYTHTSGGPRATWTVLMSDTPEGETVEIFRGERLDRRDITPPTEGIFFFRACLSSAADESVWYAFWLLQQPGSTDYTLDIGFHTAVLTPGAKACGAFGSNQHQRVGEADVPVLWSVLEFNGDLNFLDETSFFVGTSVSDLISLSPPAFYFKICAANNLETTATLSFAVLDENQS